MRRLSLLVAIACLASMSLTVPSAVAFHGHRGYGYGCGGYYGGYGGYYGASYGGPAFYGPRTAYYSTGPHLSAGPYFSGPINGPTMYSRPYRYQAYYGQPYYSSPIAGQPYASTPVYGQAQSTYSPAQPITGPSQRTTAMYPPAYSNGQVRTAAAIEERPRATVAIAIQDDSFQPASQSVQLGTTVRWTNAGSHNHTASAQDNSWDSGDIAPGATYSLTFQHPGTYYYYCRHHAGMQGTIVVGSASAPAASQPDEAARPGGAAQPGGLAPMARPSGATPARNY